MLFIDTNFSDLEIETAQKAACQRGEKLVVIPKNYKDYTPQIRNIESLHKKLNACKSKCEKQKDAVFKAQIELDKFKLRNSNVSEELKKELDLIRSSKGKVTNFTISGHDGAGIYSGYKSRIDSSQIESIFKDYSDINDVSTLLLLGCYTAVQKEIPKWKAIFPKVKMIGGYDGSAPLSDKPMGHHYLEDLLLKEKEILEKANESQLNDYVSKNIRALKSMHTAIYVEPKCEEDSQDSPESFYYGSSTTKSFKKFNLKECEKKKEQLIALKAKYDKFQTGELEPPTNPSSPEIKSLYDEARAQEHCIEILNIDLDVNAIFNIRFYEAVKDNYSRFYEKNIDKAQKAIDALDFDKLKSNTEELLKKHLESQKDLDHDLSLIDKDIKIYIAEKQKNLKSLQAELNSLTTSSRYKSITSKMTQNPPTEVNPEEKALIAKVSLLSQQVTKTEEMISKAQTEAPGNVAKNLKESFEQRQQSLNGQLVAISEARKNRVWSPSQSNLKKFSRKKFTENIHNIYGLLTLESLSDQSRSGLTWILGSATLHLIHFQNPFEWHESSAIIVKPETAIPYLD